MMYIGSDLVYSVYQKYIQMYESTITFNFLLFENSITQT